VNDDPADNSVVDDGCPSTKYAYDNLDRLQSVTGAIDYLGRVAVTSYAYDSASNLTQRTDARGLVTKYFPDDLNRLDLIEHWNGTTLVDSVDYTYDAVGFRTQMIDSTGTTTYTPDTLDRISSVTTPGPKTVGYTYDDAAGGSAADYPGQRTKVTYPDGKYVDYTYLADGRMSTVTDWLAKQTAYTYDDGGRLTKTQLPNGVYAHDKYDAADRLTCVLNDKTASAPTSCTSGTVISKAEYTLDAVGNRTSMAGPAVGESYHYDALYRITNPNYPGQSDAYIYDANGNRTLYNEVQYSYDAADQLTCAHFWWEQCPSGGTVYGYDANGNQTSRGSDTFTYDHENRLTQSVIGVVTSSSVYNGDGLRMSHTVSGQTTSYTWDVGADLPVALQDGTNTYVYGLDLISATDASGNQNYYLHNGLGSVRTSWTSAGARRRWTSTMPSGSPLHARGRTRAL
jgi:YD repeat-containing protein